MKKLTIKRRGTKNQPKTNNSNSQKAAAALEDLVTFPKSSLKFYPHECSDKQLEIVAKRALVSPTAKISEIFVAATGAESLPPVATFDKPLAGSAWPFGSSVTTCWVGSVQDVVERSSLTESEREIITLAARRQSALGVVQLGFALGTAPGAAIADPRLLKPQNLAYVGSLALDIRPKPSAAKAIHAMRAQPGSFKGLESRLDKLSVEAIQLALDQ